MEQSISSQKLATNRLRAEGERVRRPATAVILMAGTILVLFAIDYLSKAWVQMNMEIGSSIPVVPDLVRFSYYVNRGAASGFGQHWSLTAPLLAVGGALFVPVMLFVYRQYTMRQGESLWIRVFLVTALAATISTVLDRARYGYVVDFIAVGSLPIFNFADILPPIGALAVVLELTTNRSLRALFRPRENEKNG